jgi:hypothetical protein
LSASPPAASSTGGLDKKTIYGWALNKKGPGAYPGPFRKNYIFLATARIDITTTGINITATRINNAAATRINNIATGFRDFSIRTFGIF